MPRNLKNRDCVKPCLVIVVAGALCAAGATGPARAGGECDWSLGSFQTGFVPDFDQIRQGFVNDGYALCVPTSAVNWLAWLDAHGHPSVIPGGPINFQAQSSFNAISACIAEMANYMDTDYWTGTGWGNAKEGVETWLDTYADPDDFSVGYSSVSGGYVPTPFWAWALGKTGYLVSPVVGWYRQMPYPYGAGNAWFRNMGHIFSMNGMTCNGDGLVGEGSILKFRDPADDYYEFDLANQSQFSTREHELSSVSGRFTTKSEPEESDFHQRTHYRVEGYAEFYGSLIPDHVAMFEGYAWIRPLAGYSTGINSFGVVTHDPNQLDYITLPPVQTHAATQAILIADLVVDPLTREHVLLARQTSGLPDPVIRAFHPETGLRTIFTATAPRRAEFDRFGNLYILDGAQIRRVEMPGVHEGTGAPISGAITPAVAVDAIAADDRNDVMYAYARSAHAVVLLRRLAHPHLFPATTPMIVSLPGAPPPTGTIHIAVDPRDSGLWIRSDTGGPATKYLINPTTGAASVADSCSHADMAGATGIDVGRSGRLYMTKAQIIMELSPVPGGGWARTANSDFAGLAASGVFRLARGRTNYTPGDIDTLQNVPPIPACARLGDLNWDGAINAADLALLLGSWGPCGVCAADLNGDGTVGAADMAIMLGAWGACR